MKIRTTSILRASGLLTSVWKEHAEDGSSVFLRNAGHDVPNNTVSSQKTTAFIETEETSYILHMSLEVKPPFIFYRLVTEARVRSTG